MALLAGYTHEEVMRAGKRLTVTPNGEAVVRRDYEFVKQEDTVITSETTFGPYLHDMLMIISCTSGDATFSIDDVTESAVTTPLADALAALTGYSATGTLTLQVVNGVLTWV